MIEIKCTKKQKEELIKVLDENDFRCDIVMGKDICASCESNCRLCIEHNIKWDIQPEPLKPCPFCGGESELIFDGFKSYVHCKICGAETKYYDGENTAIEQWNRRVKE